MSPINPVWKSISDPNRRNILFYLLYHENVAVMQIAKNLNLTTANVSQHLEKLQQSKLVKFRKNGTSHCFMLTKTGKNLTEKMNEIEKDFLNAIGNFEL